MRLSKGKTCAKYSAGKLVSQVSTSPKSRAEVASTRPEPPSLGLSLSLSLSLTLTLTLGYREDARNSRSRGLTASEWAKACASSPTLAGSGKPSFTFCTST